MAEPIPEDTALFRLLTAAHKLAEAAAEVIACAHAPKAFADNLAAYAGKQAFAPHPLDDAFDTIADAIVELHRAGGDDTSTEPLAEAAARWLMGADL